jgi:glycosyltransferase involved in cell wall biosynthesis
MGILPRLEEIVRASDSKGKVCILTSVHPPFDPRIFHKEAQTLVQAGHEVVLIAPYDKEFERVDGVHIMGLPKYERRFYRPLNWWRILRTALREKADVYHFHDPELLPVGILLKLTTRACVVYDVHENYPWQIGAREWLPRPLRGITSWGIRLLEGVAATLINGVVAATEHIAVRFPIAKTRVVKNYPLLAMIALSPEDQRTYEGNYTLIYTGGLTDYRGIYQIVQALAYVKTPQARLTLLGRNTHPNTAKAVREMPGFERVDDHGHVSHETVFRYLNSAAVGLVCNQPQYDYDLAQPTKLFEYMCAGLPVIASNFDLWKDIVEGNECGVTVNPTDPQQIARAIDYLLGHPEIRRTMGENARRAIREEYNWERESLKLLSLYREVLHQC